MPEPQTIEGEFAIAQSALARATPASDAEQMNQVERLVKRSDHRGATERARALLARDAAHAQMLAYFGFGVFLRFGPPALPPLLGMWHSALTEAWDRLHPEADRPRAAADALRWMLRNLVQRIDFHGGMEDATYAAWRETAFYGRETIEASAALRAALSVLDDAERVVPLLAELDARVHQRFSRPKPPPPPAPEAPPSADAAVAGVAGVASDPIADETQTSAGTDEGEPDTHADGTRDGTRDGIQYGTQYDTQNGIQSTPNGIRDSIRDGIQNGIIAGMVGDVDIPAEDDTPEAPAAAPSIRLAPPAGPTTQITLTVSPALAALLRKMHAFARLVEADDLARAAIVAEDIEAALDDFDPRAFLPGLLADHLRRVVAVADAMQARDDAQSAARRTALSQLYRADLDAFLE